MPTTIITKNGSGEPSADKLTAGELAVDLSNKRLYTKDTIGNILELGTNPGPDFPFPDQNGLTISDVAPLEPNEGDQWLNSDTAEVFIYDGAVWLEFPQGTDGAPGQNGADGKQIWSEVTPDGDIYYDAGNVGIGTSNPSFKLENTTAADIGNNTEYSQTRYAFGRSASPCYITAHREDFSTNSSIVFHSNGNEGTSPSEKMRIDSTGNVGIGTADVAHTLEIASNGTALNDRAVRVVSDRAKNVIGFGSSSGAGTNLPNIGVNGTDFVVDNGGSTRLTIDSAGNVGIGDVSPSRKLTAIASQSVVGRFESTGSIGGMIGFADATTSPPTNSSGDPVDMRIGSIGDEFHVFTGNASRLTIDATGNATFSGTVSSKRLLVTDNGVTRIDLNDTSNALGKKYLRSNNGRFDIVKHDYSQSILVLEDNGNGYLTGTWGSTRLIQDGSPVVDAKGLIKTLSTLRNATKDETTLEGMRDAMANAIGGLIENLEHEIATMPAPEPEASTMPAGDES